MEIRTPDIKLKCPNCETFKPNHIIEVDDCPKMNCIKCGRKIPIVGSDDD